MRSSAVNKEGDEMRTAPIPGYTLGSEEVPRSPVSPEDFELLKASVLFGDEDIRFLRMARDVLSDQVEDVLDVWYGFVASNLHLVHYFTRRADGQPDEDYLARVRRRFGQWILDTTAADYDQAWLDYQYEIGLRHHRQKKNRTDEVDAVEHIPLRYLIAFIYPITATVRPFLEQGGHSDEDVEKMHDAWRKAVILQVALWSQPYAGDDF
jgi:Protoglobin